MSTRGNGRENKGNGKSLFARHFIRRLQSGRFGHQLGHSGSLGCYLCTYTVPGAAASTKLPVGRRNESCSSNSPRGMTHLGSLFSSVESTRDGLMSLMAVYKYDLLSRSSSQPNARPPTTEQVGMSPRTTRDRHGRKKKRNRQTTTPCCCPQSFPALTPSRAPFISSSCQHPPPGLRRPPKRDNNPLHHLQK